MKRLLSLCFLSATAFAADNSGVWTISGDIQGYDLEESCTFTQTADKIAGPCKIEGTTRDTTGTIDGKKITFTQPGEYNGQALTLTFIGFLDDKSVFHGSVDVQPLNVTGTFSLKKEEVKP
jgi:hypothetical protein